MRAYTLSRRTSAVVFAIGVAAAVGCEENRTDVVELRSSPLRSFKANVIVPAFFGSTTTSASDLQNPTSGGSVIANFANGPGANAPAPNSPDLSWINAMKSQATIVLGYVDNPAKRWIGDVVLDIRHWKEWYGVNGIFFDESVRSTADSTIDDVARNQGLQQIATQVVGSSAPVVFNWGSNPDKLEQYVFCGQPNWFPNWTIANPVFMNFEGPWNTQMARVCDTTIACPGTPCSAGYTCNSGVCQASCAIDADCASRGFGACVTGLCQTTDTGYSLTSFKPWVFSYPATTFANIVYATDPGGADLSSVFPRARTVENAAYLYVTDSGYLDTIGCRTHRYAALAGRNAISTTNWFPSEVTLATTYNDYADETTRQTQTCPVNGPQAYPGWMYTTLQLPLL
jgi:hypothetical protein